VIAYLAGLHASGLYRPSLIVAPATVLRQWLRELRVWYPPFRVFMLHDSARSPAGARCRLCHRCCGARVPPLPLMLRRLRIAAAAFAHRACL
jgi:hypothetical protein